MWRSIMCGPGDYPPSHAVVLVENTHTCCWHTPTIDAPLHSRLDGVCVCVSTNCFAVDVASKCWKTKHWTHYSCWFQYQNSEKKKNKVDRPIVRKGTVVRAWYGRFDTKTPLELRTGGRSRVDWADINKQTNKQIQMFHLHCAATTASRLFLDGNSVSAAGNAMRLL